MIPSSKIERVAIIFDDKVRPETTGTYCREALREFVECEHFLPDAPPSVPQRFDLYLRIDDGLDVELPADLHPLAFWVIDTHLDFERSVRQARHADLVFAAQTRGVEELRQRGIDAQWLPLACDPRWHRRHRVRVEHDLCFVGNLFAGPRVSLIERLQREFPRMFVGRRYFEEMARTYSASKLAFNRSIGDDLNMRVFEALGCGTCLLTNQLEQGQSELFQDGVHLVTYTDADELVDKAKHYLMHDELRQEIAAAGQREVHERHTYADRMREVLTAADQFIGRTKTAVRSAEQRPRLLAKDNGYFQFDRPELIERTPASAGRVLDVGCGAGRLGAALKSAREVVVTGIERDSVVATAARDVLDHVLCCDVEQLLEQPCGGPFDAVVCGDVLEHLRDPLAFLRRAKSWLADDGVLIASIPNVRHYSVVASLLAGNWTYEAAGLLDDDHLRFFTTRN